MASLSVEIVNLRRMLLSMGAEVEQRVQQAFTGLLRHDLRQAEAVRDNDDVVDQFDVSIEAECAGILALHQPVASDLRYVIAALRLNSDLEKIADLARGIAKKVIKLEYVAPVDRPEALAAMSRLVLSMLSDTLRSLTELDAGLAREVRGRDKQVDSVYKSIMCWAAEQMRTGVEQGASFLDVLAIVRSMERIADLCADMAESIVFAADGSVVRHARVANSA